MNIKRMNRNFETIYQRSLDAIGQDLVRRYTLSLLQDGADRRYAHFQALDMVLTQHQDVVKKGI